MKRRVTAAFVAAAITLGSSMPVFAAGWQWNDTAGWRYGTNADNTEWYSNGWQWIDGKCYYFGNDGYILMGTTTPDGYTVDASGAWTVDGVVQMQETAQGQKTAQTKQYSDDYSGVYMIPVYWDEDGNYHTTPVSVTSLILTYDADSNTLTTNYGSTYKYVGIRAYDGCTMFDLVSEEEVDWIDFVSPGVLHIDGANDVFDDDEIFVQRQ